MSFDWMDYCPKCLEIYCNCICSAENTPQDKQDKKIPPLR